MIPMEGKLLFDFAGTAAANLDDFQCVRTHLSPGPGGSLESASRVFFEQARAGEGQFYDVLSLRFTETGSEAVAIVRSYLLAHRRKKSLAFLVPEGPDARDYTRGFHRFNHPGESLEGWCILNFSGRGLEIPGADVIDQVRPERPAGMPIETWAWWVLEEKVLRPAHQRRADKVAVCLTPSALEAVSVLRQSRELNEGRLSHIYVSDEPGGPLRLLDVWDRRNPEEYERRFGI
jgi:hypothetical protein